MWTPGVFCQHFVVLVQHDFTQSRVKELGLLGFGCVDGVFGDETFGFLLHCGGFTLERRIGSGFAVLIIVLLILDTALLAALHELREGGLPPTAALEKLLGLRHCQVPCAKNVNTRVEVDFLRKFVSLLLKPQMFLDRRFLTHCWAKRGPHETHVSHEQNRFDGKSKIPKKCRESRAKSKWLYSMSCCKIQSAPQRRSHDGVCMAGYPHRCIHTKQAERRVPNRGSRGASLHKNNKKQEHRFNHGPNSCGWACGWRKVASKSPSMHALLPTMSSIALDTRAVHSG